MPSNVHDISTNLFDLVLNRQIDTVIVEFSPSSSTTPLARLLQDVKGNTASTVEALDVPRHRQ